MPKQNAFMAFVTEWKRKNAPNIAPAEAVRRAGPFWERMSTEERKVYAMKCTEFNQEPNKSKKGASTCIRTSIEAELESENEQKYKEHLEIETIQETIRNAEDLKNEKFYFIFINFFIPKSAVPAEIALVEFSLKQGVCRKKHWYVNPQANNFYGMLATAMEHVSETHQLPLPPNTLANIEPPEIYNEMLEFLRIDDKGRSNSVIENPLLFTCSAYKEAVQTSLASLVTDKNIINLQIYSIQQLFYYLKCATSERKGAKLKNIHITNLIFDRDSFEFEESIGCQYHQEIDRTRYCALSKVIRWAYTFADYMLNDLQLEFIPGKHCPQKTSQTLNVRDLCEAASDLSLDKKASELKSKESCEVDLNKPLLHTSFRKKQKFSIPQCDASSNLWKRNDTSLPPDSHHFEIDPQGITQPKTLSTPTARSYRGRGIAILDIKNVPRFSGIGRGRLFGRGIAILNDWSFCD